MGRRVFEGDAVEEKDLVMALGRICLCERVGVEVVFILVWMGEIF